MWRPTAGSPVSPKRSPKGNEFHSFESPDSTAAATTTITTRDNDKIKPRSIRRQLNFALLSPRSHSSSTEWTVFFRIFLITSFVCLILVPLSRQITSKESTAKLSIIGTTPTTTTSSLPKLDEEGNNINSPYYTEHDEHHQKTDPGDDWLIKYMDASIPLNVKSDLVRNTIEQSHDPKSGPLPTLVTIVGAGTAGLAAARQLQEEHGIHNYIIVEATSRSGGRVRKDTTFVNSGYPIDLGAAVVHRPDLVEDYADLRYQRNGGSGDAMSQQPPRQHFEYIRMPNGEVTFYNYSFYDWVMDYVAPQDHEESTLWNCPVESVTSFGNRVFTKCRNGATQRPVYIESRYVIMTASLQVLRDNTIRFHPPLPDFIVPQEKNKAVMWKGGKLFIEFSHNFFPGQAFCLFHCPINEDRDGELEDGESFYWDHGIPGYNILTGFIMGEAYKDLEDLDDQSRIRAFLKKMDELFNGQASKYYVKHVFMDWTREQYQRGTYSSMGLEGPHIVHGGQIIMAGEAFPVTEDGQGWVHGALFSGETAADYIASHWKHIVKDCGSYRGCELTDALERKQELKETNVAFEPTEEGLVMYDTRKEHVEGDRSQSLDA
ncbi:amine oxidase [Nitzschia inconspicua]|uniref:Amine oxidase n=1 Tax=Nitzschia inconspicua TaxID=303405 RepID=A0A9K3Q7Y3_9STRA|nr:amine oxidase [Nitzschia inconspicua]KAG7371534.1 amine oxidase [Nitzschia inconspicua]